MTGELHIRKQGACR